MFFEFIRRWLGCEPSQDVPLRSKSRVKRRTLGPDEQDEGEETRVVFSYGEVLREVYSKVGDGHYEGVSY
jgi:hypothetical protein